jgi:hypothetical protein
VRLSAGYLFQRLAIFPYVDELVHESRFVFLRRSPSTMSRLSDRPCRSSNYAESMAPTGSLRPLMPIVCRRNGYHYFVPAMLWGLRL